MDSGNEQAIWERKNSKIGFILDLLLVFSDLALAWVWPRIIPVDPKPGQHVWTGIAPLFGMAVILYVIGLWLYRPVLAMLSKKTLAAAKFDTSISYVKDSDMPVLVFSSTGRTVSRAGFDLFWFIGFNAILLVAFCYAGYSLIDSEMVVNTRLIAGFSLVGLIVVTTAVNLAFWIIGTGKLQQKTDSGQLITTALLQVPFLICLLGVVSSMAGGTVMPQLVQPTVAEKILQVPVFALLYCLFAWFLFYIPRRIWSLPLPGSISRWKFWGLLFVSYGIRLVLFKFTQ
jgi:hypothetical protein